MTPESRLECPYDDEAALRYLSGAMPDAERQAFEDHYFACDDCLARVQALQAAADVLAPLAAGAPVAAARVASSRRRSAVPPWAMAAGLAAVSVGAFVVLRSTPPVPPPVQPTPVASLPAPSTTPSPAWLVALARVEPASYVPLLMRGEDPAPRAFRAAMEPYLRGDFPAAAAALREVVRARPQDHVTRFYLGVSELLAGETDPAIDDLGAVGGSDPTLVVAARFYRAKAWLRKGDITSALPELQAVATTEGPRAVEARRVLEELAVHSKAGP
jgi:anti-sigma factor RsiW